MYAKLNEAREAIAIYPYSIGALIEENPNTIFFQPIDDATLNEFGVVNVEPVDAPQNELAHITEGIPELIGGIWKQTWIVTPFSQEEKDDYLADLKARKNVEIDSARELANSSTFQHDGLTIACDPVAFKDIASTANHIALFGTFPPDFPGGWKGKTATGDVGYIPMPTIDHFKTFYSSMTTQGTANFNKSEQLKQALANATTPAEVNAIAW